MKTAKEMFEELGFAYYDDDGFTTYLKAVNIPNKLNTEYIKFKKISFNRLDREMSVCDYKKDALCQEFLKYATPTKINYLTAKELQAINKQVEELGWLDE